MLLVTPKGAVLFWVHNQSFLCPNTHPQNLQIPALEISTLPQLLLPGLDRLFWCFSFNESSNLHWYALHVCSQIVRTWSGDNTLIYLAIYLQVHGVLMRSLGCMGAAIFCCCQYRENGQSGYFLNIYFLFLVNSIVLYMKIIYIFKKSDWNI